MAASRVSKEVVYVDGERSLLSTAKFVYDVEIFRFGERSYNLEDSKFIQTSTYSKDTVEVFEKDKIRFKKVVTLISAPESWLVKNKFTIKP